MNLSISTGYKTGVRIWCTRCLEAYSPLDRPYPL